jgi:hypothetical protein
MIKVTTVIPIAATWSRFVNYTHIRTELEFVASLSKEL